MEDLAKQRQEVFRDINV